MLSRVADSLYWMARYLERAEHTSRIIGVQLDMMLDRITYSADQRWSRVLACLGDPEPFSADRSVSHMLLYDLQSPASIVSCISAARENCRQARNLVSSEMWEHLNRTYHRVRRLAAEDSQAVHPAEFLIEVTQACHMFRGISDSTMSHSEGWQFIEVGQYLERAINSAIVLDTHFAAERDHLEWVGLLRSFTAFEAYCRVHTADIRPDRAAEFLLLNPDFPHSVRFAVDRVARALSSMPAAETQGARPTRLAGRVRASLSYIQIEEIIADGIRGQLDEVRRQCLNIHSAIHEGYIDYVVDMSLIA